MLSRIVAFSTGNPRLVAGLLAVVMAAGVFAARALPIDAIPDVSTVQVAVLTNAPGLSPIEVERAITFPLETALNGLPHLVELRSVSRAGLSAVTVVFRDGTDVWFARQLVTERLREVEGSLPPGVERPQLAPVSSGLGEIYWFVVRSPNHSPSQLRTILDWDVVPRLRGVPGVVEVNTMGGDLKQYEVRVDPSRLQAHGLALSDVQRALIGANRNAGGGYVHRDGESFVLRGEGLLRTEDEIRKVVVTTDERGTPVLVEHVADVGIGAALRYGVVTRDGRGEVVAGIVMMLLGENSRDVTIAVRQRIAEIGDELPAGVVLEPIYDRSDFVGRTLRTVGTNLVEGALVVLLVLAVFLGSIRGALAVVLGIPASMSIAIFGMHLFGVTGDLMSLGAIDFGFLVDGPVVVLEAIIAAHAGKTFADRRGRATAYARVAGSVARPVAFSVAIIMLVYVPLLSLEGIEGKMFRPMALTMACALFGALVYSIVFFPALTVLFVPPPDGHGPSWVDRLTEAYSKLLPRAIERRGSLLAAASALLVLAVVAFGGAGADFVPRIFEGDAVVTIRRAPSIGLDEARDLDLAAERVLRDFPEVLTTVGMTGRSEVAYDPVGNDNTDMLVRLRPIREWTSAHDFDALSVLFKQRIESAVPGTFVSVSQPIEDRTNELISGSRADVAIQVFGPDLDVLRRLSDRLGAVVRQVRGAGDVRVERVTGQPTLTVRPIRSALARHGVGVDEVFSVLESTRVGLSVGSVYEDQRRFDLRVLLPPRAPSPDAVGDLVVRSASGSLVPIAEVADVLEEEGPSQVRREGLRRTVRVEVNLRGRDLVSWVAEAQSKVAREVDVPSQYEVTWGGQFENFERARARLAYVVPIALAIIFAMLLGAFGEVRYALAVFATIPFALIGGIAGLLFRSMPFSIPAAVGFIALAGVSVLNGVILATAVRERLDRGAELDTAILDAAGHSLRAVITCAAVAALGFAPMAVSTGAGAEVQQPLATVVVSGIVLSTAMSLFLFPGLLRITLGRRGARALPVDDQ